MTTPEATPDRLYLERWPEDAERDDSIHYEQTGYGDDLRGHTSTITVYVRENLSAEPTILALLPHVEEWKADVITEGVLCTSCLAEFDYGVEPEHKPDCRLALALAFARGIELRPAPEEDADA